jgi:hypothetical protein
MSTTTNGRAQRTSLAQQIDRLDLILDNLSEGLQEAVAEAVKSAVTRAVEAALVEVLTNPELRRHLMPEPRPVPKASATGTLWAKATSFASRCVTAASWAVGALRSAAQVLVGQALVAGQSVTQRMQRRLTNIGRRIWWGAVDVSRFFRQVRRSLVVALGIGVLVGVGCFVAGPMVASAVSGFAGFVGSLATVLRWRWLMAQADHGQDFDSRVL